ncbi:RodZ domain-containing protein [Thermophilibacter sp.]|uniref:helix-turn-helix domain-containing protein n=1 Tax=Thermophilibacter sp. TaxID=2847309 RepID=UPI003A9564FC
MSLPRFSEALARRRRELGLSIAQASRTLKLREDVLVAFEEGDFEHMPQSGYAQGMLSSYARYLGLNAREIVDLFQEEVYQYQHGTSSHELRRRTRQTQSGRGVGGYDMPNEVGSRPKAYVEYRPLLPTGGGPAGDLGDFATTAEVRRRSSVPLAGVGTPAPGMRGSSGYSRLNNAPVTRERPSGSTARRRPPASRRRDERSGRLLSERQYLSYAREDESSEVTGRLYLRDDVSTRRVRAGEYTDDLRLDDEARPYASAATTSGRRSSRNIASVERPNVRRRPARGRSGGSSRPPQRGGLVAQFLSDPRRALFALIVLLAVVLTAIILFSVSSCVSGRSQGGQPTQVVPVETTDSDSGSDTADEEDDEPATDEPATDEPATDDEGDGGAADDANADADAADAAPEETVVEVSVESGSVSWVEITCDGTSEVADSVTGPWSQTFTVHESITIQVANPDAVTVTKNGERVELSPRAGGLGSVTIEGTPAPADADNTDEGATGASTEQQ